MAVTCVGKQSSLQQITSHFLSAAIVAVILANLVWRVIKLPFLSGSPDPNACVRAFTVNNLVDLTYLKGGVSEFLTKRELSTIDTVVEYLERR